MKKILVLLLACATPFVYGEERPTFEETDESVTFTHMPAYTCEIDDDEESEEIALDAQQEPTFEEADGDEARFSFSVGSWGRYKSNFGMEKILIRFPQKPAVSQSNSLMTAYAYDHAVMYSFAGHFPPLGCIDPICWFDQIRYEANAYPYNLISYKIIHASNGDWLMDYIVHDYYQNLVIKARAIATPFNGYILQCIKPNGEKDYFGYFLDNFWINCECDH